MSTQPWHRLPEETGQAFSAFNLYRDLPIRCRSVGAAYLSLKTTQSATEKALQPGVARQLPEPPNSWKQWFSTHDWQKRVRAWDRHQSKLLIEEKREEAINQGLHFRQERQINYTDLHLMYGRARENVLANLREGDLCERREKTTQYTKEKGWHTTEHRTLMREQVRIVEKLRPVIFPLDNSIPVDEDGCGLFFNHDTMAQHLDRLEIRERPYHPRPKEAESCYVPPKFLPPDDDDDPPGKGLPSITFTVPTRPRSKKPDDSPAPQSRSRQPRSNHHCRRHGLPSPGTTNAAAPAVVSGRALAAARPTFTPKSPFTLRHLPVSLLRLGLASNRAAFPILGKIRQPAD
ncbi:MAG: hypothetical protein JWO80_3373 [Bryobacterales bacterium]|nr:hypothetical protein [Bryobacterales bacterium]